jgi:hypothetical protein
MVTPTQAGAQVVNSSHNCPWLQPWEMRESKFLCMLICHGAVFFLSQG